MANAQTTNVTKLTIALGAVLSVLGLAAYLLTGAESLTAALPAFLGIPILILGGIAVQKPESHRHMVHAALLLAVLGAVGSFGGLFRGDEFGAAAAVSLATIVLCAAYIAAGVRSFIAARKSQ